MSFDRATWHISIVLPLCLLLGMQPGVAAGDLSSTVKFDIPPQQLPSALLKYSAQSGVQVTSPAEIVEHKFTAGVTGTFVVRDALEKLLAGAGLAYEVVDANTVAITVLQPARPTSAAAFNR